MRNRAKRGRVKAQDFGTELDVTRLVNTVDVAEGQSGQVTTILAKTESLNGLQRIFSSGVELLVDLADNTVFFATDNADFDFEDGLGLLGEGKESLGNPPLNYSPLAGNQFLSPTNGEQFEIKNLLSLGREIEKTLSKKE